MLLINFTQVNYYDMIYNVIIPNGNATTNKVINPN